MATDLDRAWIINGDDLRIGLSARDGRPPLAPNPGDVAAYLLDFAGKPLDEMRWPMTRGELATRLGKALDRTRILVGLSTILQLSGPDGDEDFGTVYAHAPAELATELLDAIDAQGTEAEGDRGSLPRVHPGNAADEALQRCRAALSRLSPDNREHIVSTLLGDVIKTGTPRILAPLPEPDDGVPPDVTAAATVIRELETLSGTSGAGWDHMANVLRFAAGHFGYELTEPAT